MKLFGYSDPRTLSENVAELAEVTVNATPSERRRIAEFLVLCADAMERMGEQYSYLHLADRMNEFCESPQFVVMKKSADNGL